MLKDCETCQHPPGLHTPGEGCQAEGCTCTGYLLTLHNPTDQPMTFSGGIFGALPAGARPPTAHARTLVPAFCDADPLAPSAGAVRLAFRAHLLWFNAAGFAVLQWQQLPELVGDDRERIKLSLCELYSRAYFESCFAAHFDRADPQSDMHVLRAIAELFGPRLAEEVHAAVAACGPVRQESKKPS